MLSLSGDCHGEGWSDTCFSLASRSIRVGVSMLQLYLYSSRRLKYSRYIRTTYTVVLIASAVFCGAVHFSRTLSHGKTW